MKESARSLAIAFTLAVAGTSLPARAETPSSSADSAAEARQQYQIGTQAFAQKRYSEAALHFEAAASFKANAVALYTAALAWDLASRPERAADAYARSLEVPGLDAKQTNIAKERVSVLEKSLGVLIVRAPEGWKVQLDAMTEVRVPAKLHGAPGVHTLTIRAPDKPIKRRDVPLDAGKTTTVELVDEPEPAPVDAEPVEAPSPPQEPEPIAPSHSSFLTTRRAVGVGLAGVGLAALGAAALLGLGANGAKDAYEAAPTRAGFDHASNLEMWTNVTLIGGALLASGGILLVALSSGKASEPRPNVSVSAAPNGVVVGGIF